MVIFLYGADTFRSQKKIEEIKKKFLSQKSKINIDMQTMEAKETKRDVLHSALFVHGFAKKRLIILKNLFQEGTEDLWEEVREFVKKDSPNILIIQEKEISPKSLKQKAKQLYLLLRKKSKCQEFALLKNWQVKEIISRKLQENDVHISPPALDSIVIQTGNNLWQVSNLIDKILSWADQEKKDYISLDDISNFYSERLSENEIFRLMDALNAGQKKQALEIATHAINEGEPLNNIIFALAKQFQTVFRIKLALIKTKNQTLAIRKLGIHPYYFSKLLKCSSQYTFSQLKKIYHQFLMIDLQRKTSKASPELILDLSLAKFI